MCTSQHQIITFHCVHFATSDHNIPLCTLHNIKTDRVDCLHNLPFCFYGPTYTACLFSEALGRVMLGRVMLGRVMVGTVAAGTVFGSRRIYLTCGGQSDAETGSRPSTPGFPRQNHSTIAPYPLIHSSIHSFPNI